MKLNLIMLLSILLIMSNTPFASAQRQRRRRREQERDITPEEIKQMSDDKEISQMEAE